MSNMVFLSLKLLIQFMYLNSLLTIGHPFRSVRNHQVCPSLDKGDMFHFQGTAILSRVGLQHFKMVTMRIKTMETVQSMHQCCMESGR